MSNVENKINAQPIEETMPVEKKEVSTGVIATRCIAIIVSVIVACVSILNCVGKLADAKVKVAEKTPVGNRVVAVGSNNVATSDDNSAPVAEPSDNTGDVPSDTPVTPDPSAPTDGSTPATPADNTDSNKPVNAADMNQAQIVALFNNAANGAKSSAKSIKQNYTKNSQVTGIELKMKALASLADKLIKANMGEDESKHNKTYTGADKAKFFPVAEQSWSSKLTEADIKEATVKENNGTYSVVIKLKNDTQPNLKAGEGHAGKAFSLVTKEQIVEGAGSAGMAVIKEESIKVNHSNCVIKATIDKATGQLKTANYYRVWKLELTAIGIDVGISFGIEEDFVINW